MHAPPPSPRPPRPWKRIVLAGLALGLLVLALRALDLELLRRTLANAQALPLVLGLGAYVLCYFARAVRFRLLLVSAAPPLVDLTAVMAVHNLSNMLLPARTGELSWLALAKERYGVPLGEGAVTLLLSRLFDVGGIAAWFLLALLMHAPAAARTELWIVAGLVFTVAGAITFALAPLANFAGRIALGDGASGWRLAVGRKLEALAEHARRVRARGTDVAVFVVTQIQWLCTFVTCWCILVAFGVDFPFLRSILGSTGLSLALILPLNTFGNVGTFEAGWVAGYRLAGMEQGAAAATAVGAHVAILVFALVLAAAAAVVMRSGRRRGWSG
ncbi:MAG: flippase-like domain-containing protein [Planctomycetes bacterium]|nr:flippase-like domain-containing protein [Planctomycetota bacterium]MCC7170273.1 flippase-like domain-containing protein [Planctomycetota bacterium]